MSISGHRTVSVFKRYNITDDADIAQALERTEAHTKAVKSNVVPLRAKEASKTEPLGKLWEKSGKSAGPGDEPGPLLTCA